MAVTFIGVTSSGWFGTTVEIRASQDVASPVIQQGTFHKTATTGTTIAGAMKSNTTTGNLNDGGLVYDCLGQLVVY